MLEAGLFIAGGALAGTMVYLVMRPNARALAERTAQLAEEGKKTDQLRNENKELTGQHHAARKEAERVPILENQIAQLDEQLKQRIETIASLQTAIEQERKASDEKLELLNEARKKLSDAFANLAAQALQQNNESFIQLAGQQFGAAQDLSKAELEKRQQAISDLVKPLQDQLQKYEKQIQDMDLRREHAYGELRSQVVSLNESQKNLDEETRRLVNALRAPQVRGRWGEVSLRRAVELAGMVDYCNCDFQEQVSVSTEDGKLRPDMVINLPAGRHVVVDVKTPLKAYIEAVEETDTERRKECLRRHAEQVAAHIDRLSQQNYSALFDFTPEFVVMFIPNEGFLSAALEQRSDLIEHGLSKNVILATPATLFSLLRTVERGWREDKLTREAQQIRDLGCELYARIATLLDYLGKLGASLENSVKHYNEAMNSIQTRLLVQARRFPELGIDTKKSKKLPEEVKLIGVAPTRINTVSAEKDQEPPDPAT